MARIETVRGTKVETQGLFRYLSLEQRVPQDHPIRAIADRSLAEMDSHCNAKYFATGRPSIPRNFSCEPSSCYWL